MADDFPSLSRGSFASNSSRRQRRSTAPTVPRTVPSELTDLFPDLNPEMLLELLTQLGSCEKVINYMLDANDVPPVDVPQPALPTSPSYRTACLWLEPGSQSDVSVPPQHVVADDSSEDVNIALHLQLAEYEEAADYAELLFDSNSLDSFPRNSFDNHRLFGKMPGDVLFKILNYLSLFDICRMGRVSSECLQLMRRAFSSIRSLHYLKQFQQWPSQRTVNMIASFPNVERLSLARCHQFISFHRLFKALPETLVHLNLSGCKEFTDEDLLELSLISMRTLKALNEIDISGTSITDDGLLHFSRTEFVERGRLRMLRLADCQNITSFGVKALLAACVIRHHHSERSTGLESLSLHRTRVTDDVFAFPLVSKTSAPTLKELHVQECSELTEIQLRYTESRPIVLQIFNASCCQNLSVVALIDLVDLTNCNLSSLKSLGTLELRNLPALHTLSLATCINLQRIVSTAEEFPGQASAIGFEPACPALQHVNLFNCRSLDWRSFRECLGAQPALISAQLNALSQLSQDQAVELVTSSRDLVNVNIDGCRFVQSGVVQTYISKNVYRADNRS